jgi:hypothetical protein
MLLLDAQILLTELCSPKNEPFIDSREHIDKKRVRQFPLLTATHYGGVSMQSFLPTRENTQQQPLISVCCICQRQRTSLDTWEPVVISDDNREINLTHVFCPSCIQEHFPDIS